MNFELDEIVIEERCRQSALAARVIGGAPWVEKNLGEPILVDANFSTFWSDNSWTPSALKALLNSTWCQLLMEALGTPLGGGALKLEAAHMRNLPLPVFSKTAMEELQAEGARLLRGSVETREKIDRIVFNALCHGTPNADSVELAKKMTLRAETLRCMRQKNAA